MPSYATAFKQRPDKKRKNGPICSILHHLKNIFPGGMPPDPANLLRIFGTRRHWPPPMRMSGAACEMIYVVRFLGRVPRN